MARCARGSTASGVVALILQTHRRLIMPRRACLGLILAVGVAHPGLAQPPTTTTPASLPLVLYLSTLSAEEDDKSVSSLRAALMRFAPTVGPVALATVNLGSPSATDPQLGEAVRVALQRHRPTVVFAATPRVARMAQGVPGLKSIVFEAASDPRWNCLVDTLVRPGRNATGYSSYLPMGAKMLEALRDAYPAVDEVVVLTDGHEVAPLPCTPGAQLLYVASSCDAGFVASPRLEALSPATSEAVAAVKASGLRWRLLRLCGKADVAVLRRWLPPRHNTAQPPTLGVLVPMQYLFYVDAGNLAAAMGGIRWPAVYSRHRFMTQGGLMSVAPTTQAFTGEKAQELLQRVLTGTPPPSCPCNCPKAWSWASTWLQHASKACAPACKP